jgi:EpsI family protein
MAFLRVKFLVVAGAMAALAATAHHFRPSIMLADELPSMKLEAVFPKAIDGWSALPSGGNSVVNPQTQALINSLYSDTLSRTYVDGAGHGIMVSVAYGRNQSDDKSVHYPEVCYPAQGFNIQSKQTGTLQVEPQHTIPVKRLVASRQGRQEPITYWVTVGDKITLTGLQHKFAQLSYGFKGTIPDGMIFRVSSIGEDHQAEFQRQAAFIQALTKALGSDFKPRVVGHAEKGA